MACSRCGRRVAPAPDSTWVLAWYSCPRCGHEWSARIRNGRPDPPPDGRSARGQRDAPGETVTTSGEIVTHAVERALRSRCIYWHRQLPPLDAEMMDEHVLEATSGRVRGSLTHRDELWNRCYEDLMSKTNARLWQEVERLGGDYAHVLHESIGSRHDDATGEAWLHGRFTYVLYRRPRVASDLATHSSAATAST